jgi:hypothetical protein
LLAPPDRSHLRRLGALSIRVQAAVTALVFVLSSLIGLVHEATTRHVVCAEHGELMHGALETAERAAAGAPAQLGATRDPAIPGAHGHEHCSLTSTIHNVRVEPRPPALVPAPPVISDVGDAAPRAQRHRGDLVYRTAPKTSPPA